MANELYTRTNQKLYFAGLLLEDWKRAEQARAAGFQAHVAALREAALFHLYGAALGLCHEIAGYYRLGNTDAPRIELLLSEELQDRSPSPEFAELLELSRHPETWLARLLAAYAEMFRPPVPAPTSKADPSAALIQAVSLEDEVPPLARDELEAWRQQLKQLALRFRESLTEC